MLIVLLCSVTYIAALVYSTVNQKGINRVYKILMCIIPVVLIQYECIRHTVHTQPFIIVIQKATCFGCTSQPSLGYSYINLFSYF
jgi:hypothetical protein